VVAQLRMTITPVSSTEVDVDQEVLDGMSGETAGASQTMLIHEAMRDEFRLTYDRRWYITGDYPTRLTLRLLDRGELIAQCHISPVSKKAAERQSTLEEYQRDVQFALGERFGELTNASQWEDARGQRVYCVAARGKVDELPIVWRYYLMAHPHGQRVAIAFTVEEGLAARLGDLDQNLVRGLEILEAETGEKLDTASRKNPRARATNPR
jgi:hypothetical protein